MPTKQEPQQKTSFFQITKERKLIQVFPEICKYSCSAHDEVRNFELVRQYYRLRIGKVAFRLLESIEITCKNCGWKSKIPGNFARKVFRQGLQSHLVIKYAKSKIISSRLLNIWASLWRVWLITFGVLVILTILKFNSEAVQYTEPAVITFQDVFNGNNVGKIVTVTGKVDYTLALTKDITVENNPQAVIESELYMPLFAPTNNADFVVIKGGKADLDKVYARKSISNLDFLKNQDYTITGRVQTIDTLENADLEKYFNEQLPEKKLLNKPKIIINSYDVKTFDYLVWELAPSYIGVIILFASSLYMQIFIDKKIALKK